MFDDKDKLSAEIADYILKNNAGATPHEVAKKAAMYSLNLAESRLTSELTRHNPVNQFHDMGR